MRSSPFAQRRTSPPLMMRGAIALSLVAGLSPGASIPAEEDPGSAFHGVQPVAAVYEHIDGLRFREPTAIFYDATQAEVYVADSANGTIGIFDADGVPKFSFLSGPRGERAKPVAVCADARGDIYVLNAGDAEVAVFSFRGEPLRQIALGKGATGAALECGPDGHLYIVEADQRRILVIGTDGSIRDEMRRTGSASLRFHSPHDLAFDAAGNLHITDRRAVPVQVYTSSGRHLRSFGKRDVGPRDFATPSGVAVDRHGRVFVADPIRQDIKVFGREGVFLGRFGGRGRGPGQVLYPTDVALSPSGRVYVLERIGQRLQIFDLVAAPAEPPRGPEDGVDPAGSKGARGGRIPHGQGDPRAERKAQALEH